MDKGDPDHQHSQIDHGSQRVACQHTKASRCKSESTNPAPFPSRKQATCEELDEAVIDARFDSESRCSLANWLRSHNVLLRLQPIFNVKAVNTPSGFVELIRSSCDFVIQGFCVSSGHFLSEGWVLRLHNFSSKLFE